MTQKQPSPQHIVEYQHTVQIDGHPFEYAVWVTVHGEVLSTESLFARLPEAALKLTYGKDGMRVFVKASKYEKLFRYRLPLVFSGILEDPDCDGIIAAIAERRKEIHLPEGSIETGEIGDEWTKSLYRFVTNDHLSNHFHNVEFLKFTAQLVQGGEYGQAFSILGNNSFKLAEPIIYELLDSPTTLREGEMNNAYEVLKNFPSDKNRDLLHAHFHREDRQKSRGAMIKALSAYADEKTWHLLSRFYREHFEGLEDWEAGELLVCLANFQSPEAEEMIWDVLLTPEKQGGYTAFRMLKEKFSDEEEIAGRIRPLFENAVELKHRAKYLTVFSGIENPALMPSQASLLEMLEKSCEQQDEDANLFYTLPDILSGQINDDTYRIFLKYLTDGSPCLKKGVLVQISVLGNHKNFNPPVAIQNRLLEMLKTPAPVNSHQPGVPLILVEKESDYRLFDEAANALANLAPKITDPAIIGELLPLTETDDISRKESVFSILNSLFWYLPFDEAVLPVYLPLLKDPNPTLRVTAIEGLKFSQNHEVREQVQALKDDPDNSVKRAVVGWQNMHHEPYAPKIDYKIKEDLTEQELTEVENELFPPAWINDLRWLEAGRRGRDASKDDFTSLKQDNLVVRLIRGIKSIFKTFV